MVRKFTLETEKLTHSLCPIDRAKKLPCGQLPPVVWLRLLCGKKKENKNSTSVKNVHILLNVVPKNSTLSIVKEQSCTCSRRKKGGWSQESTRDMTTSVSGRVGPCKRGRRSGRRGTPGVTLLAAMPAVSVGSLHEGGRHATQACLPALFFVVVLQTS